VESKQSFHSDEWRLGVKAGGCTMIMISIAAFQPANAAMN
jgi:hypothetical protein